MAVIALLYLPSPATSQALQDEREAFEYAKVLYSDELYETAAEEFRRFIQNYPTSERLSQARLRLADAYFRAQSLKEAVEAYQIFADRHPNNIEVAAALRNRATALEQLSENARAAAAFSDLYERFRTGEYAVQDLLSAGTNWRKAGDPEGAGRSLRTIMTNHPTSPLLWEATYNLGLVLTDQQRDSEALALFESIKNSEREPDALLEIGKLSLAQDNLARAERTFSSLRKRFPKSRSAQQSYLTLGRWYEDQQEWSKASQIYDTARSAGLGADHQQMAILGLARVYRETGRDALQLYAQFLKVYPNSQFVPDARLGLGRSYVDKQQYREAIEAFKRLQESFPDHPFSTVAHRDIGDVYAALGSSRRALAAYQRHLDQEPESNEAALTKLNMGSVYRTQLGWNDLALRILAELSEIEDPRVAGKAQFQLGQTHESADNPDLAIREYREYLERFAGQPEAREAERRIQILSMFAPTKPVDRELVELLGNVSDDPSMRLQLGRILLERRHYDDAVQLLEPASKDTTGQASEASYHLAEALLSIDRRQNILDGSKPQHSDRILGLYRQVSDSEQAGAFADDAAMRAIEIQHEGADSTSVRARIAGFGQFAKTYPTSDRLLDVRLKKADAHLVLDRAAPGQVKQALADYRHIAAATTSGEQAERANYGIGRCLAIQKNYVDAENALRDFLFAYPGSALAEEAQFQLGLILLERGYLQSAADEFADLLKSPTSVDLEKSSRALLAECYFRLEDFAAASRIDETLLARDAEPAVLKRLGEAYTRLGHDEKAITVLGIFAREFPSVPGADTLAFRRAELLAQLGRTGQAIDAFESLSSSYPKSVLTSQALASVGRLYFERGNYKSSLAAVSGSASREESITELRILSLLRLDRSKQARQEIKSFKKAFPASKEALARFDVEEARVQLRYGNPKGGRKTLERVIKNYAGTQAAIDAEYYLIDALEKVGKPEDHFAALLAFVKNRKENQNWASANLALAAIQVKEEDYVSASRAYLNALGGGLEENERARVFELLYDAHRNLRLYDSAISYARNLVEQYPHHPLAQEARISIGEMYSEKGDHRKAIDELRPQLTKLQDDEWSSVQLVIAKSHQDLSEYESALREYLKMVYNHQGSVNWLANAFYGRAECFRALQRYQEALAELDKITARFSGTAFVLQADQLRAEISKEVRKQQ